MKNIFVILCALFFVVSCDKDNKPQSSEPEKQEEASNQSATNTVTETVVEEIVTAAVATEGGITTDVDRKACAPEKAADSLEYLMCGYKELQQGATTAGAHQPVKKYNCPATTPQLVTTREYLYYGSKPDNALVCEVLDTSTGNVVAYYKEYNACQNMDDSCVKE